MNTGRSERSAHASAFVNQLVHDADRRNFFFARFSVPSTLLMATWKFVIAAFSPSIILIANGGFSIAFAWSKRIAVRAYTLTLDGEHSATTIRRIEVTAYRRIGAIVAWAAGIYALACLPSALGWVTTPPRDRTTAILVAAFTAIELGVAVQGTISARRGQALLREALNLSNVAGTLVLLTLVQDALLAFIGWPHAARANGISGVILGLIAASIGAYMHYRPLPDDRDDQPPGSSSGAGSGPGSRPDSGTETGLNPGPDSGLNPGPNPMPDGGPSPGRVDPPAESAP